MKSVIAWWTARHQRQLREAYQPRLEALRQLTAKSVKRKAECIEMKQYREQQRRTA